MQKHIVVLTGAGISAESGIKTFRDFGGLWENYKIEDVASPQGWRKQPEVVLDFYNQRRRQLQSVQPNAGHHALAELEKKYKVSIITQNVDDLHERAGSTNILHLHGELRKVRSVKSDKWVMETDGDIRLGDLAPDGGQLRPHIVWFGEEVPLFPKAVSITESADIFIVIGTSLLVNPAAGLVNYTAWGTPVYIIDPGKPETHRKHVQYIVKPATEGVPELVRLLLDEA